MSVFTGGTDVEVIFTQVLGMSRTFDRYIKLKPTEVTTVEAADGLTVRCDGPVQCAVIKDGVHTAQLTTNALFVQDSSFDTAEITNNGLADAYVRISGFMKPKEQ